MVYAACGVTDAVDVGRLAGQVEALAVLAGATEIQWSPQAARAGAQIPLRFIRRQRAAGRIAVEDHGPKGAKPVVVTHTPTSGRRLPQVLVRAMHAAGLRPISVERPGYGLTTPAALDSDPLEAASADLVDVLNILGLEKVRVLGRGCMAALAFAALHPERFDGGLLIGPSTPDPAHRRRDGLLGAVVSLVLERPHLMRSFATLLIRGSSPANIRQVTRAIVRHSPRRPGRPGRPGDPRRPRRGLPAGRDGRGGLRLRAVDLRRRDDRPLPPSWDVSGRSWWAATIRCSGPLT